MASTGPPRAQQAPEPQPVPGAGYGYPPQAPPNYWQPPGVPPVYTCSTPAQPYYQQQPQPPMATTYYVNTPLPPAYPYQQHADPIKPDVLGKYDAVSVGAIGQTGADVEDPSVSGTAITADMDIRIRHAFVRKVYCILTVQLLMTFGLATAFTLSEPLGNWLLEHWWLSILCSLISLVLSTVVCCFPQLGRRFPLNFVILTVITAGIAMLVCLGGAGSRDYAFFWACGITGVVVIALTLFAVQVKYDFTGWGPYLMVALLILCLFGILCAFFPSRITSCAYAGIGAILISFVLVYDTQQVVGGKHRKYQYSVDDYVFGALTLYLDIVTLFMNILTLVEKT